MSDSVFAEAKKRVRFPDVPPAEGKPTYTRADLGHAVEEVRRELEGVLTDELDACRLRLKLCERSGNQKQAIDERAAIAALKRLLARHRAGTGDEMKIATIEEAQWTIGGYRAVSRISIARLALAEHERAEKLAARLAFYDGIDDRPDSGWCGEHPRRVEAQTAGMVGYDTTDGDDLCLACEVCRLAARLAGREQDMKTVADAWRAKVAEVEAERDRWKDSAGAAGEAITAYQNEVNRLRDAVPVAITAGAMMMAKHHEVSPQDIDEIAESILASIDATEDPDHVRALETT